ncbi:MAG: hypothetical protein RR432_05505 [Alistipes sp.]
MKLKRILSTVFALFTLCSTHSVLAQYYTWGSDPASLKWSVIRTPDVRMIYPDTVADIARRTLRYIEVVKPDIGYGFSHSAMRIPFVMHPENFRSNGLVMWLPKRVEFLTSPAVDGYSMPWYKQLVAHEYRHAVQYNNLNRGLIKVLSYLLGQQGSTLGLLYLSIWTMEGDAVMSETNMSSFGRGLQPSFSMGYRALGNIANRQRNGDKWFCGSYREYVPDHYQLGYQICSYAYERFDTNIWDKVAWYGARNPYLVFTESIALKKFYKTSVDKLFHETFGTLQRHWNTLPQVEESAVSLNTLPEKNYTTYSSPLPLNDSTVLVLKSDYDTPSRFVRLDTRTGTETVVCHTGTVSTRPALGEGRVWWTEYRRSKLFEQRVNSQLCYMDLSEGRPRTYHHKEHNVLYPTTIGNDTLAWVAYNPNGQYSVVVSCKGRETRFPVPRHKEIHGLAWDEVTIAFYVLVTDEEGMWLARIDQEGLTAQTKGAYITLSNLRAAGGKLYFGSIASGKDEVHCYDLLKRCEYQLSTSTYGSFDPAPAGDNVLMTTYDRRGYRVTRQSADSLQQLVTPSKLPVNLVNPVRKRWDVVNLDTVKYTPADSVASVKTHRSKRYAKFPNLVNFHSWMPVAMNPFELIDEHNINLNLGVTVVSQNLLSNTEGYISYGWNRAEGSLVRTGFRYFGLGVQLELDGAYGGNQMIYSIAQTNPLTGKVEYQQRPSPDKYYSIGTAAILPLLFQRGYHTRQLSFSAGWNFSNGLVANVGKIHYDEQTHTITNIEHIGFEKGLHKLSFGVGYSDLVRPAHRDFVSPWGYVVSANYAFNPANRHFSDLISFYGKVYTPGFFRHNSLVVAATYQTSLGGYKLPNGQSFLGYKSTRLLPRGFKSEDIQSDNYLAASVDYQFPLWYPEGGIPSLIYFKRIRLNLGGDFAQFRLLANAGERWHRLYSYGADLIFDFNIFRQPASATSSIKLSLYKPSEGGAWFSVGVGLPF